MRAREIASASGIPRAPQPEPRRRPRLRATSRRLEGAGLNHPISGASAPPTVPSSRSAAPTTRAFLGASAGGEERGEDVGLRAMPRGSSSSWDRQRFRHLLVRLRQFSSQIRRPADAEEQDSRDPMPRRCAGWRRWPGRSAPGPRSNRRATRRRGEDQQRARSAGSGIPRWRQPRRALLRRAPPPPCVRRS